MNRIIKIGICSLITLATVLLGSLECQAATADSLAYSLYLRQGNDLLLKDYRGNEKTKVLEILRSNDSIPTKWADIQLLAGNKPLFALKTNLLFDVASILNLEVEVPMGKRWSVAGELIFPWWLWENKQHCLQVMSGTIEGRYWLGDRRKRELMTGWFAAVHVGGGYYDLEWNHKGYQGEFFLAAGVGGGYAHTINRKGNLRMEYSLGIGYLSTNYRYYEAGFSDLDNSWHLYRQETGQFSWIGPTRAKISLVWMLDTNLFKKRGGRK